MAKLVDETPIAGAEIMDLINQHDPDIVLPSGYCYQRNTQATVQSSDPNSMSATFAIVTRTKQPNRYGNQLQLMPNDAGKGPVTQYYKQNPVVLYDHGMSGLTLPVGLSEQNGKLTLAWSESQGIATCYFSQQPWAEPIFAAVDEKLLRMASIGFDPLLAMRLTTKGPQEVGDPSGVQDLTWLGMDFVEWELLEWSVVPIGADRGALRQALDRGKIHDCKIPNFLRQSFEKHAAKLERPGIGVDFRKLQMASVTVEGPTDEVTKIEAMVKQAAAVPTDPKFGLCPVCRAPGIGRDDGTDQCANGHQYSSDKAVCAQCHGSEQVACAKCMTQGCPDCGGSGFVGCPGCVKQSDDAGSDPDIAPSTAMSYPSAELVAQNCVAQIQQSQIHSVEKVIIQSVNKAITQAVQPVAQSVSAVAAEFKRMTGKLD